MEKSITTQQLADLFCGLLGSISRMELSFFLKHNVGNERLVVTVQKYGNSGTEPGFEVELKIDTRDRDTQVKFYGVFDDCLKFVAFECKDLEFDETLPSDKIKNFIDRSTLSILTHMAAGKEDVSLEIESQK